jgi:hypothetical protein
LKPKETLRAVAPRLQHPIRKDKAWIAQGTAIINALESQILRSLAKKVEVPKKANYPDVFPLALKQGNQPSKVKN